MTKPDGTHAVDPETPVAHRHGAEVHVHGGLRGFVIGSQRIPDAYPQWDEHTHLTMDLVTGATLAESPPSRPVKVCDHCEEAPVATYRVMHGPFGPVELALCAPCGDDFDEMIAQDAEDR